MSDTYHSAGRCEIKEKKIALIKQLPPPGASKDMDHHGRVWSEEQISMNEDFFVKFNCKVNDAASGFTITISDKYINGRQDGRTDTKDMGVIGFKDMLSIIFRGSTVDRSSRFYGKSRIGVFCDLSRYRPTNDENSIIPIIIYNFYGRHDYILYYRDRYLWLYIDGSFIFGIPIYLNLAVGTDTALCLLTGFGPKVESKITIRDFIVKNILNNTYVPEIDDILLSNTNPLLPDKEVFQSYSKGSEYINIFGKYRFISFSIRFTLKLLSFTIGFLKKPDDTGGIFINYQNDKFCYYKVIKGKRTDIAVHSFATSKIESRQVDISYSFTNNMLAFFLDNILIFEFLATSRFPEYGYIHFQSVEDIKELSLDIPKMSNNRSFLYSLPIDIFTLTNTFLDYKDILRLPILSSQCHQIYSQRKFWLDYMKVKYCNFDYKFDDEKELSDYLIRYFCGFTWRFPLFQCYYENYHLYSFDYRSINNDIASLLEKTDSTSLEGIYGISIFIPDKEGDTVMKSVDPFKDCKILKIITDKSNEDIIKILSKFVQLKVLIIQSASKIIGAGNLLENHFNSLLYLNINSQTFDFANLCTAKFENLLFLKISYETLSDPELKVDDPNDIERKFYPIHFFKKDTFPKLTLLSINDRGTNFNPFESIFQSIIESKLPIKYLELIANQKFLKYRTTAFFDILHLPKLETLRIPPILPVDYVELKTVAEEYKIRVFCS